MYVSTRLKLGFFDQGCRESAAVEVTRPERPRFGGQGCQESFAVAILARLYQAAFPGKPGQKPGKPGLASLFQAGRVFGRAPDARERSEILAYSKARMVLLYSIETSLKMCLC